MNPAEHVKHMAIFSSWQTGAASSLVKVMNVNQMHLNSNPAISWWQLEGHFANFAHVVQRSFTLHKSSDEGLCGIKGIIYSVAYVSEHS